MEKKYFLAGEELTSLWVLKSLKGGGGRPPPLPTFDTFKELHPNLVPPLQPNCENNY